MTTIARFVFPPALLRAFDPIARWPNRVAPGWPFSAGSGFDVVETGAGRYRITVDVAGYDENELSVEQRRDVLVISGEESGDRSRVSGRTVSRRCFRRAFALPDSARVANATLKNGLLSIEVETDPRHAGQAVRIPISQPKDGRLPSQFVSRLMSLFRRLKAGGPEGAGTTV